MAWVVLIAGLMLLAGCASQRIGLELYDPNVYTKADVDAINAEAACKAAARTPVQIARCDVGRR